MMMTLANMTSFDLNTGAQIPAIAYGTYGSNGEDSYKATLTALRAGYRHIDTAARYQNEAEVGRAIRDSGVPRHELFITTKMAQWQAHDPLAALELSLGQLGLEYVDLYLVHWPFASIQDPTNVRSFGLELDNSLDYVQIWHKFQNLPPNKARALGVSNYTAQKLSHLLDSPQTTTVPAVLQVELHPELPQAKLVEFAQSKGIVVEAYCPLAQGQINNSIISSIASKRGADPGQVALAWNLSRGVVVLPRSVTPSRIESNLVEIKLEDDEIAEIARLGANQRRIVDPEFPGTSQKIFTAE